MEVNALRDVFQHTPHLVQTMHGLRAPTGIQDVKIYVAESDKVSAITRLMMWLLCMLARLELDTKQSVGATRQHMLALCLGECLSSMHIVRPFSPSLTEQKKKKGEADKERKLSFSLSIWSKSSWHADVDRKPESLFLYHQIARGIEKQERTEHQIT